MVVIDTLSQAAARGRRILTTAGARWHCKACHSIDSSMMLRAPVVLRTGCIRQVTLTSRDCVGAVLLTYWLVDLLRLPHVLLGLRK